ncbi:sialidase family protein [Candidatus Ventrimonas sp. KK005]
MAVIYNPVKYNADTTKTVWPDQRCPIAFAISDDGGKTWPYKRIVESGEGFVGEWNDINNRRYEYPVMMQSRDGKIHAAYSYGNRRCMKYVCVDEGWIRGEKNLPGAEGNPNMPCQRG